MLSRRSELSMLLFAAIHLLLGLNHQTVGHILAETKNVIFFYKFSAFS